MESDWITYTSVPSLEHLGIISVAIELIYKQSDIKDAIRQHIEKKFFNPHNQHYTYSDYEQLENSVLDKLSLLPLPNLLKKRVSNVISPLLLQILHWMCADLGDLEYLDNICWNTEGTISIERTFQQIIHKENSSQRISFLYELACRYCLKDNIPELWDKLPLETQKYYLYNGRKLYKKYKNHLIAYWTRVMTNKLSGLFRKIKPKDYKDIYDSNNSVDKNMFLLGITEGNISAVKYFWNKLPAEEISINLEQWIDLSIDSWKYWEKKRHLRINRNSDVLYFLISQLKNLEKQKEVFMKNSCVVLLTLYLDWPWQRFLMPTIQTIWFSLDEDIYTFFLSVVVEEITPQKTTEMLFRELWYDSPINLKKSFIKFIIGDCRISKDVFLKLLKVNDMGTIKLILKYATLEEKDQICLSIFRRDYFFDSIYVDQFSFFELLLGETGLSKSNIQKEIRDKYGVQLCSKWIFYEDDFDKVQEFVLWICNSRREIFGFCDDTMDEVEKMHERRLHEYLLKCIEDDARLNPQ